MRRTLFATSPGGAPCPWCGNPMTDAHKAAGRLVSGHVVDRALGGVNQGLRYEHKTCGLRAGAHLGNALRKARRRTPAW